MNEHSDLGEIYQQFRSPLKNFISKRVQDDASAEDILHDVFVKIHEQIGTLKEKEKLTAWIYAVTRNAVIDFHRKRRDSGGPPDEIPLDAEPIPDVSEKLVPIVRSMIDRLPQKYREALLLADFDKIRQTDLARRLRISLPAVKSRVQRARKMLKDLLLSCCHFEFDRYGTVFDYHAKNCHHCCGKKTDGTSC